MKTDVHDFCNCVAYSIKEPIENIIYFNLHLSRIGKENFVQILTKTKYTLENTEGVIKNGQSRDTGNIGHTRRRKKTHNTKLQMDLTTEEIMPYSCHIIVHTQLDFYVFIIQLKHP